jgi:cytochrome P450
MLSQTHAELREPPRRAAGPKGQLVFGSLRDLQRDPLGLLVQARAEFGDVVRFRYFGPLTWYFFAHPADVEHILVTRVQDFPKGAFGRVLDMIIPRGLASVDGDEWLRQRRMVQPGFHATALPGLANTIVSTTCDHLERWREETVDGGFVDMARRLIRLSFDVVARALLGSDLREASDIVDRYAVLALQQLNYRVLHPLSPLPFLPTSSTRRYRSAVRRADDVIRAIVQRRRATSEGPHDLLSMLMSATDEEGRGLSDDEVRDQVKTLLISGYETTGATLGWFWYLLASHPDVEQRVRREIQTAIGDRLPRVEDLQAMPYTRQVMNETLRLYPPAPWLGRQTRQSSDVNGCRVPRGTVVCVSPFVTHRHPDFWTCPESFDPEHFAPENIRHRPRSAFFPFGAGPRYCVGQAFAVMEILLIAAVILPKWHLRLEPGARVAPRLCGTLQTAAGLPMTLEPVSAAGTPGGSSHASAG